MPCFPFISSTNSHFLLFRFPGEVLGSDFENQPHTIFPLDTVGQVNSSEFYYVLAGGGAGKDVIQNLVSIYQTPIPQPSIQETLTGF